MVAAFLEWFAGLDPVFAFLLVLPFAVAAAGLLAERLRAREASAAREPRPRRAREAIRLEEKHG